MGSGIICNTWQTCLRPVWARRGPCLHLADRLSRGKHLGISSISVRLLVVAQKIKSQKTVAVLASSAQSKFTLLQLLPLVVSLAFLIPIASFFAFDCSFPTRHLTSITTSEHHRSITANNSPSRDHTYHSDRRSSLLRKDQPQPKERK
jgi:hypothetical protein